MVVEQWWLINGPFIFQKTMKDLKIYSQPTLRTVWCWIFQDDPSKQEYNPLCVRLRLCKTREEPFSWELSMSVPFTVHVTGKSESRDPHFTTASEPIFSYWKWGSVGRIKVTPLDIQTQFIPPSQIITIMCLICISYDQERHLMVKMWNFPESPQSATTA